jgi:hypothetical protein
MAIDWLKSTNKQRTDLYAAVTELIKLKELTWADVYEKALGLKSKETGTAFNENFRKGKISKANAALIYRYLSAHHPDCIPTLNAKVSTASAFWDFLSVYRRLGDLALLPELIEAPLRVNQLGPAWREFPFETSDPICFRLRLPYIYETVCALNGGWQGWYPIALKEPTDYEFADVATPGPKGRNARLTLKGHRFIKAVTQGAQIICSAPPTENERKRRLRTENFFVFLAGEFSLLQQVTSNWQVDKRITNGELDDLVDCFLTSRLDGWSVAQINAHGIGSYADD